MLQKLIRKVEEKAKTIDAFLDWCEILESVDPNAKKKINELGFTRCKRRTCFSTLCSNHPVIFNL